MATIDTAGIEIANGIIAQHLENLKTRVEALKDIVDAGYVIPDTQMRFFVEANERAIAAKNVRDALNDYKENQDPELVQARFANFYAFVSSTQEARTYALIQSVLFV